jgi:hypothetical protein
MFGIMAYTIQRQTEKLGPYDLGQVRVMAQAGEVSATDLVWKEGSATPTTVAVLLQGVESGSAASPPVFKKGPALTAFYLAALALIPGVGLFCAIPAIFFGLKGLKETQSDPQSRERMHALVGVVVGGFLTLMYLVVIGIFVMRAMKQ